MNARLDKYSRDNVRGYRLSFHELTTDTGSGDRVIAEVFGVANKDVKLRHAQISKPDTELNPVTIAKFGTGTTGSTGQSVQSPSVMRSGDSSYGGVVRTYSVNPASTDGQNQQTLSEIKLDTDDVVNEAYGVAIRGGLSPVLSGSSESFAVIINSTGGGAVTVSGYLEFSEEP